MESPNKTPFIKSKNVYDFSFRTLQGEKPLPLSSFKGKVILVVNTASKCGFTPQYKGLEALYQQYKDQGLVILGVPSNDFRGQEPGNADEIASFCEINYGVTFPLTAKAHVRNKEAHPFYIWAGHHFRRWARPQWNFHKYLINRKGELIDYFFTTTNPSAPRLRAAILKALHESPN
ncbi:MAG: glutathione peroxidase [Alphaproteobacteria bacterium]|nr:glutathione peroxidase [Alphaproteobacteria bacterium]